MKSDVTSESRWQSFLQSSTSFWWLLLIGTAVRLLSLTQPIFNNSNLRQTQTAIVTQSLIASGGHALAGRVSWMADLDARLLLELPLYNYLVLGANKVLNNLDASGKVVSVGLGVLSFVLLQQIWRRLLVAGGTSRIHSYYNLPVLGPACFLFGIGCVRWLWGDWAGKRPVAARPQLFRMDKSRRADAGNLPSNS